jgi:predicted RNA binding protein with dsRBD fold (UPF0201 family)
MEQLTVRIEVEVNPTESEEKVKRALWNLFGDLPLQLEPAAKGATIIAEGTGMDSLITLRNVLRRDHIRDAARKALYRGLRENTFVFYFNKQVAFAGHVSFSEAEGESPLGPIKVTIEAPDPDQLVDWLAPRSEKP